MENGKKIDMKELVKDQEWQKIRSSLLHRWMNNRDYCIKKLRYYLGDMKDYKKLKIVMNYLTGTGFRTGKIQGPEIQKLRNEVSIALRKFNYED